MTLQELAQAIRNGAQNERNTTAEQISLTAEALQRRLWTQSKHPDLYRWLIKECKYSQTGAYRRIAAARVFISVPETRNDFEEGRITLTALAALQSTIYQEERRAKVPITPEAKRKAALEIQNKSTHKVQQTLAQMFPDARPAPQERIVGCAKGRVVTMVLSDSQYAKFVRLKEVLSHSHPDATWADLVELALDRALEQKDPLRRHERRQQNPTRPVSAAEMNQAMKDDVIATAGGRCEWRDSTSGERCGSQIRLQVDHVFSRTEGGSNERENLACLCAAHNRGKARRDLGDRHAEAWRRTSFRHMERPS